MDGFQAKTAELMDYGRAYWQSSVLLTAVKTGVTGRLAKGPASADELAQDLGLSSRGLSLLLQAMVSEGLAELRGEAYGLAPEAAALLDPDSGQGLHHYLMHAAHLMSAWSRMDEAVVSGEPVPKPPPPPGGELPPSRLAFYLGMRDLGRMGAPGMAERLGLAPGSHVLDLGGGPGVYALTMAAETPGLKATVFDFPVSERFFRAEVQGHPAADRVEFKAGNFLTDDLGGPYDLIWASHILHSMGPEEFQGLMGKAARALKPGGRIWLQDFLLDAGGRAGRFAALFALNMLVNTPTGRTYSSQEVCAMLGQAGFVEARFLGLTRPGDLAALVSARLPG